ncbi:MAG: hypothetical protein R3E51_16145 [Rhizobiaceae bacterium]
MSADDWMKYLSDKNLTKKDTETELLGIPSCWSARAGHSAA